MTFDLKINALIFDFDGLILDTEGPILQAWQETYRQHGFELPLEQFNTTIGTYEVDFDPWVHLQELAGNSLDAAAILPAREARERELISRQLMLPGVRQYLQDARRLGLKLGLASSSMRQWVFCYLESLGLSSCFDCIRVKEDVRLTKPYPDLYLAAAACLGVPPQQAIAFEDSPNGILAARRAGIYCVAVPTPLTRPLDLSGANRMIDSLADLPLEKLLEIVETDIALGKQNQ